MRMIILKEDFIWCNVCVSDNQRHWNKKIHQKKQAKKAHEPNLLRGGEKVSNS
jgi:hypothetical protein